MSYGLDLLGSHIWRKLGASAIEQNNIMLMY